MYLGEITFFMNEGKGNDKVYASFCEGIELIKEIIFIWN